MYECFCLHVCMLVSGAYKHQQKGADAPGTGGLDISESQSGFSAGATGSLNC